MPKDNKHNDTNPIYTKYMVFINDVAKYFFQEDYIGSALWEKIRWKLDDIRKELEVYANITTKEIDRKYMLCIVDKNTKKEFLLLL